MKKLLNTVLIGSIVLIGAQTPSVYGNLPPAAEPINFVTNAVIKTGPTIVSIGIIGTVGGTAGVFIGGYFLNSYLEKHKYLLNRRVLKKLAVVGAAGLGFPIGLVSSVMITTGVLDMIQALKGTA